MKLIIKKAFFSMVILFLIGITIQTAQATESRVFWNQGYDQRGYSAIFDETVQNLVLRRVHNRTYSGVATDHRLNSGAGKLYWTGNVILNNFLNIGLIGDSNLDGTGSRILCNSRDHGIGTSPTHIKIDFSGEKIYWVDRGGSTQGIWQAGLDCSSPVRIFDHITHRAPDFGAVGATKEFTMIHALTLDLVNGLIYFTDSFAKDIHKIDLNGTGVTFVANSPEGAEGITNDEAGNLYVVTGRTGKVVKFSPSGTSNVIVSGLDHAMDIITDNQHLYITDYGEGAIYRTIMDGSDLLMIHDLRIPRPRKPGRYNSKEPISIALAIDPAVVTPPVVTPPVVTPPVVTPPVVAPPVVAPPVVAPPVVAVPPRPSVRLKLGKRGYPKMDIVVPTGTDGASWRLFIRSATGEEKYFVTGSADKLFTAKIKGQYPPPGGAPYTAFTINAAGIAEAPVNFRSR
ncbi:MAG: hypothetical protein ACE5FY_03055 [Nitrospiria bacterium]